MMTALRCAAVAVLLCTASGSDAVNPDGPFGDGASREPVTIDYDTYARHIKGANRDGYYVAMLITQSEGSGRQCHWCPYFAKQIDDFVGSYKDQLRGGDIYSEDRKPLYFVKVVEGTGRNVDAIRRELHIRNMPAFVVLPPYKEGASNKPIEFGRGAIEDATHKRLKKEGLRLADELKKAGKSTPSIGQIAKRRDKRRRQLMTQEEMEYDTYGVRQQDFKTTSICKFLRVHTGTHLYICPQDAPLDFQQKQKPQDFLKNVLMLGVLGSAIVLLCRIFDIFFSSFNPNKVELVALVHKKHAVETGDEHTMSQIRPLWERYGSYALYAMWIMGYGLLAGGMYWNILNGAPWSGRGGVAQGSRQQYGSESMMLAILYSTGTYSMVLAGAALSQPLFDFTRQKNMPFSLDDKARAQLRFYFATGGVLMWAAMFLLVLRMFLMKNGSYLWNTALGPLMGVLRPN